MAEEAPVVNEQVVADTTPAVSTPAETVSSEVVDEFDGLGDVSLSDPQPIVAPATDSTAEETSPKDAPVVADETNVETQPQSAAEDRKQQLNTEIRDLVSQRNAIRAEVERQNAEAYQPATDEELLGQINPETGQYFNPLEAKVAAMQQRQEYDQYNTQVAEAQLTLSSQAQRAVSDFPMFDENSKDYNKDIAAQADQILASNLIKDPNTGQIIGSHANTYQIYQTIANAYQMAGVRAQASAQKATETMLANADTTSNSPTIGSGDPLKDLEDKIGNFKFAG